MKHYIGVNRVQAEPAENNGEPGYKVIYGNGHEGWSPKEEFEKTYFQINRPDKLTEADIANFMELGTVNSSKYSAKTTLVEFVAPTGFIEIDTSSCVDACNYDHKLGRSICLDRISNKMWNLLGFMLQWADHGLR